MRKRERGIVAWLLRVQRALLELLRAARKKGKRGRKDSIPRLLAAKRWRDVWIRLREIERAKDQECKMGLIMFEISLKPCFYRKIMGLT